MRTYYYTATGEMIVDQTISWFVIFFGLFMRAFIYSPMILTGYIICRALFPPHTKGYYWVGTIVLFAVIIHALMFIAKGLIIGLKARGHRMWAVVFLLCVAYTCVPPALITYNFLHTRIPFPWLVWLLTLVAGYGVYFKYNFLLDLVPARYWSLYMVGIKLGRHPLASRPLITNKKKI